MEAVIDERLADLEIEWYDNAAVCVVLASGGYPEKYQTGYEINGLEQASDWLLFHAGTKKENGKTLTAGGRVLGVTATADNLDAAIKKAYEGVSKIHFQDMHYRRDIGIK